MEIKKWRIQNSENGENSKTNKEIREILIAIGTQQQILGNFSEALDTYKEIFRKTVELKFDFEKLILEFKLKKK